MKGEGSRNKKKELTIKIWSLSKQGDDEHMVGFKKELFFSVIVPFGMTSLVDVTGASFKVFHFELPTSSKHLYLSLT